ncbi:hypothetical protein G5C51_24515 [Streptomyces sp. A7024]|uniref:Uncharacterized protein n=1 Tax=Streptomyces coryli TaxID=1128680 RepID=A0A6G4U6P2_9ACTN|nr:hypothetical protein [Streptomyces coryli]NGN67058.1 hypothetical protein [Streptomyces coryli]
MSFLWNKNGSYAPLAETAGPPDDPDYVEGYISITVFGQAVMGEENWDLVDQLWAYIASMLVTVQTRDCARTQFPDQPTELALRRHGTYMVISCGDATASAPAAELLGALREAGIHFFDELHRLQPSESWRYGMVRSQLERIRLG